ncbi:MAG: META domain-containing protein [Alphaproteobacteria bacterium]|jgi:heat shock protein HslJ/membrane-bound inhibitor of C-type lysozyme|nr:META domain-containing protein [Alphaproteobacteria bacterium]
MSERLRGWVASCLGVVAALGVAAPAAAQEVATREVAGELVYRERIALPPEAHAIVEVRGADDAVLAETRLETEGRQVPIPFALELPTGVAGTLRGGVFRGGEPLWVSEGVAIAAGDAAVDLGAIRLTRFEPMGFASRMTCGDRDVTVGFVDRRAILEVAGERLELTQVRAASGAKFEAADDPGTYFWSKGATALVSLAGELLPECRLAVPRPEQPFRARGNEPGWHLDIAEGRIALVTDYGAERREAPLPPADFEPGVVVYEVAAWDAVIRIADTLCRDTMTGMPFPETVTVDLPARTLRGCGGEAQDLLIGPVWVVEAIGGASVVDAARTTLDFRPDGRLAGRASCNRYTASYQLTGEGLTLSPGATTRMACAAALMDQEQRFLAALDEVARFDVDATGALLLLAADGRVLVTARPA